MKFHKQLKNKFQTLQEKAWKFINANIQQGNFLGGNSVITRFHHSILLNICYILGGLSSRPVLP